MRKKKKENVGIVCFRKPLCGTCTFEEAYKASRAVTGEYGEEIKKDQLELLRTKIAYCPLLRKQRNNRFERCNS